MNQCATCEQDFASLRAFDEHILTAASDPRFECLSVGEMRIAGWTRNQYGRWTSPKLKANAEKVRTYFEQAA